MKKYEAIYQDLLNMIESHKIKAGELLPSEFHLRDYYKASRDTVRKALMMLSQNGYIQKSQGKGSIVLDITRFNFPVSGLISFKELASTISGKVETIVNCCECIEPDEEIKKLLMLKNDTKVWYIERIRRINGEAVIFDTDILNADIVPYINEQIAQNSLYDYLEHELELKIGYAKKEITCRPVTSKDQKLMDLKNYDMIVNIASFVFLEDTTLFQYTVSRHRPDKFRFNDFARRTHN